MTYCVGVNVEEGMVFASDSRTNAGIDHVASFRKMFIFERPKARMLTLLSAGNLAICQAVINKLARRKQNEKMTLFDVPSLYDGACLIGELLREVCAEDGPYLKEHHIDASASFILGGQIKKEPQRLFLIYPQGNFIESTPDTPYLQIGETKYGKPILDRVITHTTDLRSAAKSLLVSFDSTMRSNLSVGLPIDLLVYEQGSLTIGLQRRIKEGDEYWTSLHQQWNQGINQLFSELPDPC